MQRVRRRAHSGTVALVARSLVAVDARARSDRERRNPCNSRATQEGAHYRVLGMIMDSLSMILLTVPIFWSIIAGMDLGMEGEDVKIRFGVIALIVVDESRSQVARGQEIPGHDTPRLDGEAATGLPASCAAPCARHGSSHMERPGLDLPLRGRHDPQ